MFVEPAAATEPPPCCSLPSADPPPSEEDDLAAIMLAAVPPPPQTHAVVIARRTLHPILALIKSGCVSVETHALDAPAAHLEQASLAWIADIKTHHDLETAVHQASCCLDARGRMVLDATGLGEPTAVVIVLACLVKVGFCLRTVLHQGHRLILVAARRSELAMAA